MSGNKNSALPFSSPSLAPLGSASGRSGHDSVLPLAGHYAVLKQTGTVCSPLDRQRVAEFKVQLWKRGERQLMCLARQSWPRFIFLLLLPKYAPSMFLHHPPTHGHGAIYFIKEWNAFNPFLIDFVPPRAFGTGRLELQTQWWHKLTFAKSQIWDAVNKQTISVYFTECLFFSFRVNGTIC